MIKVLPPRTAKDMKRLLRGKPVVTNVKRVKINQEEMQAMNENLKKTQLDFRRKSAASSMAVSGFRYNA